MPNASLRLYGVAPESIVDGPGLRYALFMQGCLHNCNSCHNPASHDLNGGYIQDINSIFAEIIENPLLCGVTFSGGEPFLQAEALYPLAQSIKSHKLHLAIYSGYTLEQLTILAKQKQGINELLQIADMLIDGKFVKELFDADLRFRGSSNQRIWEKIDGVWKLETR